MDGKDAGKLDKRKKMFMAGMDLEIQRARREVFSVELRRQRRIESAQKRRAGIATCEKEKPEDAEDIHIEDLPESLQSALPSLCDPSLSDSDRLLAIKSLLSSDALYPDSYLSAVHTVRLLLSREENAPICLLFHMGFVPVLMKFTDIHAFPHAIISEATWAICNLASGPRESVMEIVNNDGIPVFLGLVETGEREIVENALWTIGNIAGDSVEVRDKLLEAGANDILAGLAREMEEIPPEIGRVLCWSICGLIRGSPSVPLSTVQSLLPALLRLSLIPDYDTVRELLWALSYVTDHSSAAIRLLFTTSLPAFPISCIQLPTFSEDFLPQSVRTIGSIVSEDDSLTEAMLKWGLLDALEPFICYHSAFVRKEVMWALSNVAAGTQEHIQRLLDHRLIAEAMKRFADSDSFVRKETSWTFANIAKKGELSQVYKLLELNICFYLKSTLRDETELVFRSVETIGFLLKAASEWQQLHFLAYNPAVDCMESTGCLCAFENLVHHQNASISQKVTAILQCFVNEPESAGAMLGSVPTRFEFETK